jgi:hypothetical protein
MAARYARDKKGQFSKGGSMGGKSQAPSGPSKTMKPAPFKQSTKHKQDGVLSRMTDRGAFKIHGVNGGFDKFDYSKFDKAKAKVQRRVKR